MSANVVLWKKATHTYNFVFVCVQFSCGFRVENSVDQFNVSRTSYFVGIRFWAVSTFILSRPITCVLYAVQIRLKLRTSKLLFMLLPAFIGSCTSLYCDSFRKKLHAFVTVFCQWIRFNLNEDFYAAIVSITSSCKYNFSKILHTFS